MLVDEELLALRRVIAVANDKGGVLKTSVVANQAGLLADAGYRVLAVDLDPQGNLGEDLGYTTRGDDGLSLYRAITDPYQDAKELGPGEGAHQLTPLAGVRSNLDVVTGGEYLNTLQEFLDTLATQDVEASRTALARALAPLATRYDVVLIDVPPKIRVLQDNALVASRWLLVPSRSDSSSRKGLAVIGERFQVAREFNPSLGLLGVVLVGIGSSSTRVLTEARADISTDLAASQMDHPLLEATVRYVEAAAFDARRRGQLAHELEKTVAEQRPWYAALKSGKAEKGPRLAASAGSLAGDYAKLAEEILDRLAANEEILAKETQA